MGGAGGVATVEDTEVNPQDVFQGFGAFFELLRTRVLSINKK